jgi:uncharacterized membrane protein
MENDSKTENEVSEILRRIAALRASSVVSIEEKIEIAKRIVSIVEEDKARREVQ